MGEPQSRKPTAHLCGVSRTLPAATVALATIVVLSIATALTVTPPSRRLVTTERHCSHSFLRVVGLLLGPAGLCWIAHTVTAPRHASRSFVPRFRTPARCGRSATAVLS